PSTSSETVGPPLTIGDVAAVFAAIADAGGAGARARRDAKLAELAARSTPLERVYLARIIGGEMRTGVSDGLVLEAIAAAADAPLPPRARRRGGARPHAPRAASLRLCLRRWPLAHRRAVRGTLGRPRACHGRTRPRGTHRRALRGRRGSLPRRRAVRGARR